MKFRASLLVLAVLMMLLGSGRARGASPARTLAMDFVLSTERAAASEGFASTSAGLRLVGAQGTLLSEPLAPGWEFIALGVTWAEPLPDGATPELAVRTRSAGGAWSAWHALALSDEEGPDGAAATSTALLFAQGEEAQLRATLHNERGAAVTWRALRLTAIDGRPGPSALELAQARAASPAESAPAVLSRQQWGADERYRFYSDGSEKWPRDYWSLRALFVHHTATVPSAPDPASAVRSIYYYHAITNGWGDIGYHYLVDQYGNVYQGRYGTEANGWVVEGGHALGYNRHSMGISMIGNFSTSGPNSSQVGALQELLAWRAAQYGIDPYASVWMDGVGAISPDRWFSDSLMGHRDSHSPVRTSCPGDALYSRLPEVRAYVAARIPQISAPTVQLAAPTVGERLDGVTMLQANASPNVVRVEYRLEGSLLAVATAAPWSVVLDSRSLPAGEGLRLRATAFTATGASASDERPVAIAPVGDGLAPTPTPEPTRTPVPTPSVTPPAVNPGPNALFLPLAMLPAPPRCQGLLSNGDFHTNQDEWRMLLGDYAARYASEQSWEGPRSLRAGLEPGSRYPQTLWSSARLPLTLPPLAADETLRLTLRYLPQSEDSEGDKQYLGLLNEAGSYIASLVPSGLRHQDSWQSAEYDLAPFAGQRLFLYVGALNDGDALGSRLYVDDVQVTRCGR